MNSKAFRSFHIALKSLTANRLRVALAVLAVTIGVASVIVMVAIGKGAKEDVTKQVEAMGSNLLVVAAGTSRSLKGQLGQLGIMATLTLKDAAAIPDECPAVRHVAPAHVKKLQVKFENVTYSTRIVGTVPAVQTIRNISAGSGTFFHEDDDRAMAMVAVVGPTAARMLFGDRDPVGESIKIGKVYFKVVGVTQAKGNISGENEDDQILVPLKTAMNRLMNVTHLSHIFVEAASFEQIRDAEQQIRAVLRDRHRLGAGKPDDFTIQNQADVIETRSATARTFELLIVSMAAISIVIGGVGILGVMLLSIRERVGEIGIRRAVGARERDILIQFLVESTVLGLFGGIIGLVVGLVGTEAVGRLTDMPVSVSYEYVAIAIVCSLLSGIIFGIHPSWKAARLNPIEALHKG
jgi:putative ABC transport system permease protein